MQEGKKDRNIHNTEQLFIKKKRERGMFFIFSVYFQKSVYVIMKTEIFDYIILLH